jgi:predicted O-methyltransferase YrrM
MTNQNTITVPDSWHPAALREALQQLVIDREALTIVEIGSWLGHTAITLAQAQETFSEEGRVYCIDHWRGSSHGTGVVDDPLDLYLSFLHNIQQAEQDRRIVPIFERSDRAFELFKAHPIDLLFIDGDHAYESVLSDLQLWVPLVRAGGIVCGDDYGEGGPHRAFDSYFNHQVDTLAEGRLALIWLPV